MIAEDQCKKLEELGHKLKRNEEGEIDHLVLDYSMCSGPGCEVCGMSWCYLCNMQGNFEPCSGKSHDRNATTNRTRENNST